MGLEDGGEWEWAFNLIGTYGLVPSNRMPGTASWRNTQALNVDLHERLARATRAIAKTPDKYAVIRARALRDVIGFWLRTWAIPPSTVTARRRTLSPIGVHRTRFSAFDPTTGES